MAPPNQIKIQYSQRFAFMQWLSHVGVYFLVWSWLASLSLYMVMDIIVLTGVGSNPFSKNSIPSELSDCRL